MVGPSWAGRLWAFLRSRGGGPGTGVADDGCGRRPLRPGRGGRGRVAGLDDRRGVSLPGGPVSRPGYRVALGPAPSPIRRDRPGDRRRRMEGRRPLAALAPGAVQSPELPLWPDRDPILALRTDELGRHATGHRGLRVPRSPGPGGPGGPRGARRAAAADVDAAGRGRGGDERGVDLRHGPGPQGSPQRITGDRAGKGSPMKHNPVKRRLREGGIAVGTMMFEFNTTGIARIAAEAGAEF